MSYQNHSDAVFYERDKTPRETALMQRRAASCHRHAVQCAALAAELETEGHKWRAAATRQDAAAWQRESAGHAEDASHYLTSLIHKGWTL